MEIAVERLTWHDAGIASSRHDEEARRLIWHVEVFRWDLGHDGDAERGLVTFEDVEEVERREDLAGGAWAPDEWEVLDAVFERSGTRLRCTFRVSLPGRPNALGGSGYGELIVTCRDARYEPVASGP